MRWLVLVATVFAFHVALIFIFGARRPISPAPVKNAPSLVLTAESPGGWLALNNATLFALPDRDGFAGLMWVAMQPLPVQHQDWTEPLQYLGLPADDLGGDFNTFVQTNRFTGVRLEFNISPPLAAPLEPDEPSPMPGSTLEVAGAIAGRPMLNQPKLPSWPYADVIAPSVVQVIVDARGDVISATLLPPEDFLGTPLVRDADADQGAVALARAARFAPLSPAGAGNAARSLTNLVVGRLIFNWQTVPATIANGSH